MRNFFAPYENPFPFFEKGKFVFIDGVWQEYYYCSEDRDFDKQAPLLDLEYLGEGDFCKIDGVISENKWAKHYWKLKSN